MNETIKIGFIGAGGNTELRHAPGFKAQDKVILSGVANRSYESSKKAAEKLGIENPYENWLDLVEDDNIDAVCIGESYFPGQALGRNEEFFSSDYSASIPGIKKQGSLWIPGSYSKDA